MRCSELLRASQPVLPPADRPAAFPHRLRRPPQSLSLGSFGDYCIAPMNLRPAEKLIRSAIRHSCAVIAPATLMSSTRDVPRQALAYWFRADTHTYVAQSDGRIVGPTSQPNQPRLGSQRPMPPFMVSSSARGLGVGRRMGDHCLEEARRLASAPCNATLSSRPTSQHASAAAAWLCIDRHFASGVPPLPTRFCAMLMSCSELSEHVAEPCAAANRLRGHGTCGRPPPPFRPPAGAAPAPPVAELGVVRRCYASPVIESHESSFRIPRCNDTRSFLTLPQPSRRPTGRPSVTRASSLLGSLRAQDGGGSR